MADLNLFVAFIDGLIGWAHEYTDTIREQKGLKPIDWREQVKHKGPERYCVGCLADGDRVPAHWIIGQAGYCDPCKKTLVKNGGHPQPIRIQTDAGTTPTGPRLSEDQRKQILASDRPASELAERYDVTTSTIYNLRNVAKLRGEFVPSSKVAPNPRRGPIRLPPPAAEEEHTDPEEQEQSSEAEQMVEQAEEWEPDVDLAGTEAAAASVDINFAGVVTPITLVVTEAKADALWRSLNLVEKAQIASGLIQERWDRL